MGAEEFAQESHFNALNIPFDQWVSIPISGLKPSARYKHAAALAEGKLYISGGSRNGRYLALADIQVLDLKTLSWSRIKLGLDLDPDKLSNTHSSAALPASSGHSMFEWEDKLLVVAGHLKDSHETVTVWSINMDTHCLSVVKTSDKAPVARQGQSTVLVGSRIFMFGGEDFRRRLLNDLFALNLETMTWEEVEATGTPPAPRFDHTAAVNAGRYLLIFGGCSHSTCFNDLHILDLHNMEWSQPLIQGGVTARAGHAGATIDDNWYVVGGGDNRTGASETLVLNMSKIVWSVVNNVKDRDPLSSEGLSLCSTTMNGEKLLVAFGGYNGKYNNEVFILKPKPSDVPQPKILQSPAAAAAAASVTAAYALNTTTALKSDPVPPKKLNNDINPLGTKAKVDAIREEKEKLELTLREARTENSRLKRATDETDRNHAELSKELHSVQSQLEAERSRCFKLEVQIAEMRKNLEPTSRVEHELQMLQQQKSAWELEMAQAAAGGGQRNSSGGVWGWIAG